MNIQSTEKLKKSIASLHRRYYKQIYVVEYTNGNTVKRFSEENDIPYLNLNIELSKLLLKESIKRRPYKVSDYLNQLINASSKDMICLDYYELLFEPALRVNPFALFKSISRNKMLLIAWRGNLNDHQFIHAEPGHPEYQKYSIADSVLIK